MIKKNRLKLDTLLQYWTIAWFVLFSGSLYFQVLRIRVTIIIIGATIVLLALYGWKIKKINFKLFATYMAIFLANALLTISYGVSVNDIILVALRMSFLIIIQSNMSEETYQRKYVDIMVAESILSIICYLWTDVLSISNLPFYRIEYGSINGYMLTPYYTIGWVNTGVFHRNAGLFLEPGSHQIFLNFALLFILFSSKGLNYRRSIYYRNIFILVLAVLTTQSTTGYLCLAVIMCAVMFIKRDETSFFANKRIAWLKIVALVSVVALVVIESTTHVIEYKFAGMFTGHSSAATRYNDTLVGYSLVLDEPILGHGIFNTSMVEVLGRYNVVNISNGLAQFLIGSGLILGGAFLIWTYANMKRRMPYGIIFNILVFVFYLMCVNTEGGVIARLVYMTYLFVWIGDKAPVHEKVGGGGTPE